MADFFGDGDSDWMNDDLDEAPAVPARLPDEPSPDTPAPFLPRPSLGNAPTLVFSAVPTLPPSHDDGPSTEEALPLMVNGEPMPRPAVAAPPEPEVEVVATPVDTLPPFDVVATPVLPFAMAEDSGMALRPLPASATPRPAEPRERTYRMASDPPEEAFGDAMDEDHQPSPLIRTAEPAPARMRVANSQDPRRSIRTPVPESMGRPAAKAWDVGDTAGNWRDAATVLVSEAALAEPDVRARWLASAARIHHLRLGDRYAAEALYRDAMTQGLSDSPTLRGAADVAILLGHRGDASDLLARRGQDLSGVEQAENDVEASALAWRSGRPGDARSLLERALLADPEDWRAAMLLRDLCVEMGDGPALAQIQERMANLCPGPVAADVWVDRARSAEVGGQHSEASVAWRRAAEERAGFVARAGRLRLLMRAEDHVGIGEFADEAGETQAALWMVAGDAWLAARQPDKALASFDRAVAAGFRVVAAEASALRLAIDPSARQAHFEAASATDPLSAVLLAGIHELGGRFADAATAWKTARKLDADCVPGWEGEARCLRRLGDVAGATAHWQERVASARDEAEARFHLAGLATGDDAIAAWTALSLQAGVVGQVARRKLVACLLASESPERAGAEWAQEPAAAGNAAWLFAAARAGRVAGEAGIRWAEQALAADPRFLPALDVLRHAWAESPTQAASAALSSSAVADVDLAAALAWLAAVDLENVDTSAALDAGRAAASLPGFPAATAWVRDLTTDPAEAIAAWRALADRQATTERWAWCALAAALVGDIVGAESAADVERVRARLPGHAAANALALMVAAQNRDVTALAAALNAGTGDSPADTGARLLRGALLEAFAGRTEAAESRLGGMLRVAREGLPLAEAALVAMAWGSHQLAYELAVAGGADDVDLGDVADLYLARPLDALRHYEGAGNRLDALLGRVRLASNRQDSAARSAAMLEIAQCESAPAAVRSASAISAAMALSESGDPMAPEAWAVAALCRSQSPLVFEARLAIAVADKSGADVRSLYSTFRSDDIQGLGEALERVGDAEGAAETTRTLLAASPGLSDTLPLLLIAEIQLSSAGNWQGVFEALTRRGEITCDEAVAADIDSRRRWVLREKLADTEEAWNLYRRLRDEAPEDREVTEALARIAAARGETALAIRYLSDLLRVSRDPAECARIQRRIGDAWRDAGNNAAARQAWLDALDHKADDWESLAALKALAEAEGDRAGKVSVLRREAMLVEGPERIERLRAIAIADAEGAEPAVAMDAWRALLDAAPNDEGALRELIKLAEATDDRASLMAHSEALGMVFQPGEERSEWLRKAARLALESHDRDGALRLLEGALTSSPTDAVSALILEEQYRIRGDQAAVARVLDVAVRHASGPQRVDALSRQARFDVEVRLDRDAGARVYRQVLELAPFDEPALKFLASYLYDTGRMDEALGVYDVLEPMMSREEPDDFDGRIEMTNFLYRYGELLRRVGRLDEAMIRFERALGLNSGHLATLEAVAPLYADRGDLVASEKAYRQLLQLMGGRGERAKIAGAYTQLGMVERRLGHDDKALKRFEKAIDVFPSYAPALKGLALIHEGRGDWSNALTVYNAIIGGAARTPEEVVDAYMTKGRLLDERMSRPDKAQQHYERSLEFEDNQPVAYLRLAELAMRRDEYAQAGQWCETALHLNDQVAVGKVRALLLLGVAAGLTISENDEQAKSAIEEALGLDPAISESLADPPLSDIERLRLAIHSRLPK